MENDFLEQFYKLDSKTGKYIIDIALENYYDIFNNWDSSVYNIRGLDNNLQSFSRDCSDDIDFANDIILRFNLYDEKKDKVLEKKIRQSIKNYFQYCLYNIKRNLVAKWKKIFFYVIVYIIFISLSFYLQASPEGDIIHNIILQGITVGGWVFLWEAFSILLLNNEQGWRKKKEYKRLLKASIRFNYE